MKTGPLAPNGAISGRSAVRTIPAFESEADAVTVLSNALIEPDSVVTVVAFALPMLVDFTLSEADVSSRPATTGILPMVAVRFADFVSRSNVPVRAPVVDVEPRVTSAFAVTSTFSEHAAPSAHLADALTVGAMNLRPVNGVVSLPTTVKLMSFAPFVTT